MNNYGKQLGPSLTFSIKKVMVCNFFVAKNQNSCVIQCWPVSKVWDNFWSFRFREIYLIFALWNWIQRKSPGKYVN